MPGCAGDASLLIGMLDALTAGAKTVALGGAAADAADELLSGTDVDAPGDVNTVLKILMSKPFDAEEFLAIHLPRSAGYPAELIP